MDEKKRKLTNQEVQDEVRDGLAKEDAKIHESPALGGSKVIYLTCPHRGAGSVGCGGGGE